MEEEQKIPLPSPPQLTSTDSQSNPWLSFKNTIDDVTSSIHIRQRFYQETKSNAKKMRSNKKNPTKSSKYYMESLQGASSPLHPTKAEDHIYQTAIPNTITYTYDGLGSRLYNCKFTSDGKIVLVTSQTGTSFFKFTEDNQVSLSKVINCSNINWAITDSDLSSDNKFMIHSTLSPYVHMFDLEKSKYARQFNLKTGAESSPDEEQYGYFWYLSSLRVFSLKLSGDNKEIIAGCGVGVGGAPIQVFDIEQNKVKHSIKAHENDINSICYVDKQNSSIFISGSDDARCKIWDTRILRNNEPVGIFHGHISGITCVTSKEDSRYFISNSKDQSIKLWDLRKSVTEDHKIKTMRYDYRYGKPTKQFLNSVKEKVKDNLDQSVMTFEGHSVAGTLIRCHFSPIHGTGQRFIYTGSYDGKVYIYDTVTGDNIACLILPNTGDSGGQVVRDCAWHPYTQSLITTSFDGEFHKWEYMDLRDAQKIKEEDEWEDEEDEDANGEAYLVQEADENYDDDEEEIDEDYEEYEDDDDDGDENDEDYVPNPHFGLFGAEEEDDDDDNDGEKTM